MSRWTRRGLAQVGVGAAALGMAGSAHGADRIQIPARVYVCEPCGCAMDHLEFSGPGRCPACGMTLVEATGADAPASWLPPQLEVAVLHAPTAFPASGQIHLVYELHLRNHDGPGLPIRAIEVRDPDRPGSAPLASISGQALSAILVPTGRKALEAVENGARFLPSGGGAVAYLAFSLDAGAPAPDRLSHRVVLQDAVVEGPTVTAAGADLRTLAPPVTGPNWIAAGGPLRPSHHRFGLLTLAGSPRLGRRLAIDWKQVVAGNTFDGDPARARSHHCYGQPVTAAADGVVAAAADGFPDNVPRTEAGFTPALPISLATIAGNAVVLDLGGGQYAHYAHLKPGSVRVKPGERVRRGQVLGQIGNSGDSREPHLHFHVSDGPDLLASEGLPYLIDAFLLRTDEGRERRRGELPLGDALVDFAEA